MKKCKKHNNGQKYGQLPPLISSPHLNPKLFIPPLKSFLRLFILSLKRGVVHTMKILLNFSKQTWPYD